MEGWDVYIDIFVVTKTLQEVNALKEIPGRRDKGIGTLSKDPTSAFDFKGYRSFRYKVVSIQVVSVQIEVDSIHTLSWFDPLEVVSIQSEQLANF